MKPLASLTLACLVPCLNAAAVAEESRVLIETFANDPRILGGSLEQSPGGPRLRLSVQFANPSLFKTGVDALYYDRPDGAGGREGTMRVVQLRQRVNPNGDPDIFMPVDKTLSIPLPHSEGLDSVVVLNVDPAFEDPGGAPRVHAFAVARAGKAEAGLVDAEVTAAAFAGGRRAPTLANVRLEREQVGNTIRYAVEFDVEDPSNHLQAKDVTAEFRNQSLGDEPPTQADWLFVSVPEGGRDVAGGGPRRLRVRVATEVPAGPSRTVVVGNAVTGRGAADRGPFQILRVR